MYSRLSALAIRRSLSASWKATMLYSVMAIGTVRDGFSPASVSVATVHQFRPGLLGDRQCRAGVRLALEAVAGG